MKTIASLSIRGFKSCDRNVVLSGRDLFLGPVGAGKSTVLDATAYLFLGFVPRLGKTKADTAKLMREDRMEVSAVLSDGSTITRGLDRVVAKGRTQLNGFASCSWLPAETLPSEAEDAICRLVGANAADAIENVDTRQLFAISDNERGKRLQALLDASGMDKPERGKKARMYFRRRLIEQHPAKPQDLSEVDWGDIEPGLRSIAGDVLFEFAPWLDESIQAAEGKARDARLKADGDRKELVAARKTIEAKLRAIEVPADTLEKFREERTRLIERRAKAERDIEAAATHAKVREQAESDLPRLRLDLENADVGLRMAEAALPRVADLRGQAEAITDPAEVAPEQPVQPDPQADLEARKLEAEADGILNPADVTAPERVQLDAEIVANADGKDAEAAQADLEADGIRAPEPLSTDAEKAALDAAIKARDLAAESPWREVERIAGGMERGMPLGTAHWVAPLRALATKHGGDSATLQTAVDAAVDALGVAASLRDARALEITQAQGRVKDLRDRAATLRKEAVDLRKAAQGTADTTWAERKRAYDEAVSKRTKAVAELDSRRAELRERARQLRADAKAIADAENGRAWNRYEAARGERDRGVSANAERRAALRTEADGIEQRERDARATREAAAAALREIEARLDGIAKTSVDGAAAQAEVSVVAARLPEVDSSIEKLELAAAQRAELSDIVKKIDAKQAVADAWSAAEWACTELRKEDTQRRSRGLVARIDAFLESAGRTERAYLRSSGKETQFGWTRDGKELALEALSGGEACLYMAALAGAVISLRAPEVPLMLIEAAELGASQPAQAVLRGCAALDGLQVFVATNATIQAPESWGVHRMAQEPAGQAVAA